MNTQNAAGQTSANRLQQLLIGGNDNWAPALLRVPVGLVLAAHGAQKLFAWFGGYGLEATGQWMSSIGLEPGLLMATLAGSAEFFGGIALMLGVLTRPAALLAAFTMLIAMTVVHAANGFFMSSNGIEYSLILLFASLSLAASGAGKVSIDGWLRQRD